MIKVAGYIRVSSKSQQDNFSLAEQEQAILDKYPNAQIHKEVFTAAKDFDDRRVFNNLVYDLQSKDTLIVCKMDRFCRNTKEGLCIIEKLIDKGVIIHILNMGIIDSSPMGKLIYTILLSFAEFERNMIVERTSLGRQIARRSENYVEGRPKKFSKQQIELALNLLEDKSYKEVAQMTGISKSTLQRAKRKSKLKGEV